MKELRVLIGLITVCIFVGYTIKNVDYTIKNRIIYYLICSLIITLMII